MMTFLLLFLWFRLLSFTCAFCGVMDNVEPIFLGMVNVWLSASRALLKAYALVHCPRPYRQTQS